MTKIITKKTIIHLKMLHTTSPCTVMHHYIVVFAYKSKNFLSANSRFRTPLWLQSTTTSWDTRVCFTEERFQHYVTARSYRINIPMGGRSIFSRRYHLSHVLLPVRNCYNDVSLRQHPYRKKSVSRRIVIRNPFYCRVALVYKLL